MRNSVALLVACLLPALSGCQQEPKTAAWPASLGTIGDGFPNPGDPCKRLGESAATVNYLGDSTTLVGCLSADDAAKLGGKLVATVDGVTLVTVPR